ncbi:MAG: hypothetical protein ACE15D_18830 [Candidatus Eisenbacteria bacterium]
MNDPRFRHHVGVGLLKFPRERSVFINCPFTADYTPMFDAVVFSSLACGFLPRCALESGSVSVSRMDRILGAMSASKYSIHDLTLCKGQGDLNLARFNMPLELGIAMAQRFASTPESPDTHDWLVLVPTDHVYQRVISDLAGYDPGTYDLSVEGIIPAVMSWLASRDDAIVTATPRAVQEVLPQFTTRKEELVAAWGTKLPWTDLLVAGIEVIRDAGLIPPNGN